MSDAADRGPDCTCFPWEVVTHQWLCPRVKWLDEQHLARKVQIPQQRDAFHGREIARDGVLAPGWAARQAAQPDPHRIVEK
jgi:hypothetical protein